MITKPAVLECTRCGKIFIGYDRDVRPRGWPKCLKCSASEAWAALTGVVAGEKRGARPQKRRPATAKAKARGAGASRPPARKRR